MHDAKLVCIGFVLGAALIALKVLAALFSHHRSFSVDLEHDPLVWIVSGLWLASLVAALLVL